MSSEENPRQSTPPTAVPPQQQPPTGSLDLEAFRDVVRAHRLADDLQDAREALEGEVALRDEWAINALAQAGLKTLPVFTPEPQLRVARVGVLVVVQLDGADAAELAVRVRELLAPLFPQGQAGTARGVQPVNVTARGVLWAKRLEGVEREQACACLKDAGLADLVREDFNVMSLSARVREALDRVREIDDEKRLAGEIPTPELDLERGELAGQIDRLGRAFGITTSTTVSVTRATQRESRSSRAVKTLKTL